MAPPCVLHFTQHISAFSHLCLMLGNIISLASRRPELSPSPHPVACEPKVFRILSPGIPQALWLDDRLLEPPSPRAASETRSPVPNTLSDRVSIAPLVSSYEFFADCVTKLHWPANSHSTLQLPEHPLRHARRG